MLAKRATKTILFIFAVHFGNCFLLLIFFLAYANSLMDFYSLETNHGSGSQQLLSSLKGGIKFGVSIASSVSDIPWLSDSVLETLERQEKANQD